MADIVEDGDQGSLSVFMAALAALQAQGQSVLNGLSQISSDTLLRFQQDLSVLNGYRQRAYRLPVQDVAGQFLVSDLLDIDQAATSATVHADSSSVTLRERSRPAEATIQSTRFSTSDGSIEQFSGMYRVTTQDGQPPTGTFDIQFFSGLDLTLLVFDIVMSPSNPAITVRVSPTGVTYTPATQVTCTGYTVTAWLPEGEVKYVSIAITPTHPDTLGGSAYTFGLTSFTADLVEFQMQSELDTRAIQVTPGSAQLQLVTKDSGTGVAYFLALGAGAAFTGVSSGQILDVPGAVEVDASLVPVANVTATVTAGSLSTATLTEAVAGASAGIVVGSSIAFATVSNVLQVTGRVGLLLTLNGNAPVLAGQAVTLVSAYIDPTSGVLSWQDETGAYTNQLPDDLYGASLAIADVSGAPVRLAPGLNPAFANHLTTPVFALYQGQLFYRPLGTGALLFSVSYTAGPATLDASLKVQLITRDRARTPVFQGASLQDVYS